MSKYLSKACPINVSSGSVKHMKLLWETQDMEERSHITCAIKSGRSFEKFSRNPRNTSMLLTILDIFLSIWWIKRTMHYTVKNTVISSNFLVWGFCGKAPAKFHTRKLGKITLLFAVLVSSFSTFSQFFVKHRTLNTLHFAFISLETICVKYEMIIDLSQNCKN